MLNIILLTGLTLLLYIQARRALFKAIVKAENNYAHLEAEYDKLTQESAILKQYIFDLEKSSGEITALYDITKEICKTLELDEVFASFKEQINKYINVSDCAFLKTGGDLSAYNNYTILPLNIDNSVIGYLAADITAQEDKDKFNILAQQFLLAAKRTLLYQRVQEMAITDSLTQAVSRRYCLERFNEEVERSGKFGYNFSFLIVDIDHFKDYNDRYGHLVGDAILREASKAVKENIRQIDLIGRYGGDEFAVILTETDKEEAKFAAERIRQAVENKRIKVYDEDLKATISIGVSTFPLDGRNTQELIEKADSALYQAKQAGRNKVSIYGV